MLFSESLSLSIRRKTVPSFPNISEKSSSFTSSAYFWISALESVRCSEALCCSGDGNALKLPLDFGGLLMRGAFLRSDG